MKLLVLFGKCVKTVFIASINTSSFFFLIWKMYVQFFMFYWMIGFLMDYLWYDF